MKNEFLGYYTPNKEEFQEIWKDCIFVLDANVLLNLYRYSVEASNSFIKILESLSSRLWMSHQAAFEFQDNRLGVIAQQEKVYKQITDKLESTYRELEDMLWRGHLSINADDLLNRISVTFKDVTGDLQKHQDDHPDLYNDDKFRNKITQILNCKIGEPYTDERLNEIYKTGEFRYANKIPPGYKDHAKNEKKKFGNQLIESKYGDLIQWYQMLDKAFETKKPIVFVSDDLKEDWWWQTNGKTIGPRPELITEMNNIAGVRFYMHTPDAFMKYANDYLKLKIKQKIIDEVREFEESKITWKNEVVKSLEKLDGEAHLSDIYDYIENNSTKVLPRTWQSQVRKTLYSFSSDCEIYLGKEDLFAHVGKGRWALRNISE
jgi:hypothetical protein